MPHSDENEVSEMWRGHRAEQKKRRVERLPIRVQEILDLRNQGFEVRKMSDYQYRINGQLDIYPIHQRYHDIKSNKRGQIISITAFVTKYKFNNGKEGTRTTVEEASRKKGGRDYQGESAEATHSGRAAS